MLFGKANSQYVVPDGALSQSILLVEVFSCKNYFDNVSFDSELESTSLVKYIYTELGNIFICHG